MGSGATGAGGSDGSGGSTGSGLSCTGTPSEDCSHDACDSFPGCEVESDGACSGTATLCAAYDDDEAACGDRWGCEHHATGTCANNFSACDGLSFGACLSAKGCEWEDEWCWREDFECGTVFGQTTCDTYEACYWQADPIQLCQGASVKCEELPSYYCDSQEGCSSTAAACTGTPTPCAELTVDQCPDQPGCRVQNANGGLVSSPYPLGIEGDLADLDLWVLEFERVARMGRIDMFFDFREINRGTVTSPAHTSKVVLSVDDVIGNSDDLELYSMTIDDPDDANGLALWGTDGYWQQTHLVDDKGIPAGWYTVAAVLDFNEDVTEFEEENNIHTLPGLVYVGPAVFDLTLANATHDASSTLAPGDAISIDVDVINNSTGFVDEVVVRALLSDDATLDGTDLEFCTQSFPVALEPLGQASVTLDCTAPRARGDFSLLLEVDPDDELLDENRTDNVAVAATELSVDAPSPDLVVTALSSDPTSVPWAGDLTLTATVQNVGPDASPLSYVGFYLSSDGTLSGGDRLICNKSASALAGGGTTTEVVADCTLPSLSFPGSYTLFALADYQDAIFETDDGNNAFEAPVQLTIETTDFNLEEDHVTLFEHQMLYPGGQMGFRWEGSSTLPGAVPAGSVTFYLSTDATITTSDVEVCSKPTPIIPGGNSYTIQDYCNLPNDVEPGVYSLGAIFDAEDLLPEVFEDDNVSRDESFSMTVLEPVL